ncbi:MAG: glutathione synthase [Deltaproteobacteria bacterium]|nr:glutathione synthase [Deltaproteobacteria bacterium]
MRIAFLMDPLERVSVQTDTSFALMLAAQAHGHGLYHLGPRDLLATTGGLRARVRPARVSREAPPAHCVLGAVETVDLAAMDVVFIRTDPPFDALYLYDTLLLEALRGGTLVVNDPRGLRDANEKLYALHFGELTPRTVVTCREADVLDFLRELGGPAVIKPLDGAGGRGVLVLEPGDRNLRSIIETLTDDGRRYAVVQEFLPAVRKGDKRILLLDGEPLGAILRVPREGELRSNLHVGGTAVAAELDDDDRRILAGLGPRLRADGLYFVGIDVIGGRLTEVNVTSPTGIQELSRFTGVDHAAAVIAWAEARAARLQGRP